MDEVDSSRKVNLGDKVGGASAQLSELLSNKGLDEYDG